jgi:hypothetical protein
MRNNFQRDGNLSDEVLSRALRSLPARISPAGLTTSLRVIASRERQRMLGQRTFGHRWAGWRDAVSLSMTNFMRPMAIPFAGGVMSAVVLFSMWLVPTYPLRANSTYDIPTMLSTEASISSASAFGEANGEIVVDVTVDGQGKMVDYRIVSGQLLLQDQKLRRRLENMLLFTGFIPATSFGQPMAARMRLSLHSLSQIDVKG